MRLIFFKSIKNKMKRPFNNAGFAQVQAEVLSLSHHKRSLELKVITENFESWMTNKFRLTDHQRKELANIDKDYLNTVVFYVTERWREGHTIHFYKDEPMRTTDADPIQYRTELLLEEKYRFSLSSGSSDPTEHVDVSLHILLHEVS